MFLKCSLPVSDKSRQRTLLDENLKIRIWVEVSQTVKPDLHNVRTNFLSLVHLNQHLVHCGSH